MFHKYALPGDDLVYRLTPTITASSEDPGYPVSNWLSRKPSKPSKLTIETGDWAFDFGAAVNVAAVGLIYHNLDPGIPVLIEYGSTPAVSNGSELITTSAIPEDLWPISAWAAIAGSPTYRYWRISIGGSGTLNSYPISLGYPAILGALRDLDNDVRWGVVEQEDHKVIEIATELDVEDVFALGGKRRAFFGEFALSDTTSEGWIALVRSALGRTHPWFLVPDAEASSPDMWMVRMVDSNWIRTRETPNLNIFPYRARELARGRPWPYLGP